MNDTNMIDGCQAHLPMQYASLAKSDTDVVIDREPDQSRTCKTSFLFALWLSVFKLAVPLFRFMLLYFKYKAVLMPKLKIFLCYRYL